MAQYWESWVQCMRGHQCEVYREIRHCLFVFGATTPPVGHGLLIHEVSRSHTNTHHSRQDSSGRAISSSQRPLPDNTQESQKTDNHVPGGIRKHNPSRRAAADLRLRPRGHWDQRDEALRCMNMRQAVNLQTIYVKNEVNIRSYIPYGANVTITVSWDVTSYSLVGYQGLKRYILPHSSEQKMEAAGSFGTNLLRHSREDANNFVSLF